MSKNKIKSEGTRYTCERQIPRAEVRQKLTEFWITLPHQEFELIIAVLVLRVVEDGFQRPVESVTLSIKLIFGHSRHVVEIRLVHGQQRSRQFADKIVRFFGL